MDMLLKGKRALITGSTSGIGAQCACVLAGEGVSVVINGRSADRARLAKSRRPIRPFSSSARPVQERSSSLAQFTGAQTARLAHLSA
jgi:NAD(P)-dependent dehydrogenase (short-subunit alcohol dehydrogenase family)